MTWHNTSHHIASNDVTITWPDPGTDTKTSKHFTSKHKTSPPWKGRRLVHSKEMLWASRWSVTMRTFYRQILSVLYSSFPFGNFRPRLVRALLVRITGSDHPMKLDRGCPFIEIILLIYGIILLIIIWSHKAIYKALNIYARNKTSEWSSQ